MNIKRWKSRLRLGIELVALIAFIVVGGTVILSPTLPPSPPDEETPVEASYYTKLDGERVQCQLCSRRCIIAQGERGWCQVIENRGGTLYSLDFMRVESVTVVVVQRGANYTPQATVTMVRSRDGSPVQAATVSGQWSGATTDADSGITDANGQVVLTSDKIRQPPGGTVFTFTVTSVTHPSFFWSGVSWGTSDSATVP